MLGQDFISKLVKHSKESSDSTLNDLISITKQIEQQLFNSVKLFDPFDQIILSKNIDNQILTSFRTVNKTNNLISNTLKVIHNRF